MEIYPCDLFVRNSFLITTAEIAAQLASYRENDFDIFIFLVLYIRDVTEASNFPQRRI